MIMFEINKWYFLKAPGRGGIGLDVLKKRIHCSFPPFFKVFGMDASGAVTSIVTGPGGNVIQLNNYPLYNHVMGQYFEEFTPSKLVNFEQTKQYYRTSRAAVDVLLHLGKGSTSFRNYINGNKAIPTGNSFTVKRVTSNGDIRTAFSDKGTCVFEQDHATIPAYMAVLFDEVPEMVPAPVIVVQAPVIETISDEDKELLKAVHLLLDYRDVFTSRDKFTLSVMQGEYPRTTITADDIIVAANRRRAELIAYRESKQKEIDSANRDIENLKEL